MLYLLDVSTCGRGGAASPVGSTLVCGGATGVPAHMIVVGTSACCYCAFNWYLPCSRCVVGLLDKVDPGRGTVDPNLVLPTDVPYVAV